MCPIAVHYGVGTIVAFHLMHLLSSFFLGTASVDLANLQLLQHANQAHRHSDAATTTTIKSYLSTHSQPGALRHKHCHNCGQADDDLINGIAIFPSSATWFVVIGRHIEVPSTSHKELK